MRTDHIHMVNIDLCATKAEDRAAVATGGRPSARVAVGGGDAEPHGQRAARVCCTVGGWSRTNSAHILAHSAAMKLYSARQRDLLPALAGPAEDPIGAHEDLLV